MKRIALFVINLAFALTGCANTEIKEENMEIPTETAVDVIRISLARNDGESYELSPENSETIRQILCDGNWVLDAANCAGGYTVVIDSRKIYYHAECGTFNERLEQSNRSFHLSEANRETVNAIIRAVLLPTDTIGSADSLQASPAVPDKEAAGNTAGILDLLKKLEYRPYTCDGLPEYLLTAADGTVYSINLSEKWVWRGNSEQAELPEELTALIKENGVKGMESTGFLKEPISQTEAEEIAASECRVNYDDIKTEFDAAQNAWEIEFWEDDAVIAAQTIVIDTVGNIINSRYAE